MKIRNLLGVLIFLVLSGCSQGTKPNSIAQENRQLPEKEISAEKNIKQERLAQGCIWIPYESAALGIKMSVQDCSKAPDFYGRNIRFIVEGSQIFEYNGETRLDPPVIEVFSKNAEESMQTALQTQFLSKLSAEAQADCTVERLPTGDNTYFFGRLSDPKKEGYTLNPSAAYIQEIEKRNPEKAGELMELCGQYGASNGIAYFEYHPEESQTKFLFVEVGQAYPLFDEQSIQIVDSLAQAKNK